jgi:outer membrane protein OmpA-like peptidoglycan-associated protein
MKTSSLTCFMLLAASTSLACAASKPSTQLVDARQNYEEAKTYNDIAPEHVHDAKQALDRAEKAHDEDPGSVEERHYAYLAHREAERAKALGEYKRAGLRVQQAEDLFEREQGRKLEYTRAALEQNRDFLEEKQETLQEKNQALANTNEKLETERQRRLKAESEASAAMKSLEEVAKVQESGKETTITLSGAVLFKTGEHQLLPIARNKLDDVAAALKQLDERYTTVVEGHTDSRGSEQMNRELSQERASAVRSYLVSRGVDENRIRAEGRGEAEPIASNDDPEGRANNRRVELVVREAEGDASSASDAKQ